MVQLNYILCLLYCILWSPMNKPSLVYRKVFSWKNKILSSYSEKISPLFYKRCVTSYFNSKMLQNLSSCGSGNYDIHVPQITK